MTKMITLFGKDLKTLKFNELKRERRCHSFLLTRVRYILKEAEAELEKHPESTIHSDKVAFFGMYASHLQAMIDECDYWLDRRYKPSSKEQSGVTRWLTRKENAERRKTYLRDNRNRIYWEQSEDGLVVSWDRDKFFHIAADRGYQTEELIVSEVQKELELADRTKAKWLLNKGRFTWGQVLCLGAFLQMTPKEFCDTFLAGYFTEQFGDYRADYENLRKDELLKQAIKSNPMLAYKEEVIEIGADGSPIDEEEWFD